MYRPTCFTLRALFLQLWFLSVALSVVQAIAVPVRPAIPVRPEPIPIGSRPGGKPVSGGHDDPIRLGTHPDDGSSSGNPPRIGVDNPPSQPGKVETVEESLSLIVDFLEAVAPDAPETTTSTVGINNGDSDAIDLSKPLLPQLNMTETQQTGVVACLKTCLSPLDTLDGASACTSLIKGSLESAACVCTLDGVAAKIESCYTECLPVTVALPTNAKPSIRCGRIIAQFDASSTLSLLRR